jgi:copper(I)-binding protein
MRFIASAALAALALTFGACSPAPDPAPAPAPAPAPVGDAPATSEDALMSGALTLLDGVVFIPAEGRDVTAGFGTLAANERAVTLVAAEAAFAEAVELHTHSVDAQGRMAMRKVDSFTVPAGGVHELRRGGDHMMFFGIDRSQLVEGGRVAVRVHARFEDGTQDVIVLNLSVRGL